MPTAILIDGAYFIKRFRAIEPHNAHNAERAADCIFRWAVAHLSATGATSLVSWVGVVDDGCRSGIGYARRDMS